MKRNRVGIALSAVGIHASIGSVYAWSVLTKPVMAEMGISLSSTTWAFSIAILFLGLSAAFLGKFVERIGPRASGLLSMLFFCSGLIGTALAVSMKSVALLYFFYGAVGGIGLGIGYITPVSTLVKWFPARRGFATGLAIMGFGFASLIGGPLMQKLTALYGLSANFLIMGGAYAVVMTLSSLYLMPPKAGETVDLTKLSDDASEKLKKAAAAQTGRQYTAPRSRPDLGILVALVAFLHQHHLRHRTPRRSVSDGSGSRRHECCRCCRPRGRHRHRQWSWPARLVHAFRLDGTCRDLCAFLCD